MRFASSVVAVWLCACGEVKDPNKLPDAPLSDSAVDGEIDAPDIDAPPPRCDPAKPFGAPRPIPELTTSTTTASDVAPWLTADERTIYFASNRPGGVGGYDIYLATRADPTAAWDVPSLAAGVNTAGQETQPSLTGDGLTMYAVIEPVGGPAANPQIAVATRGAVSGSFSALGAVTVLNDADVDSSPRVLADHSALYMVSRRGGANNIQIYRVARTGGAFGTPTLVVGTMLDVFDDHASIALTPDELTLYFGSTRSGGLGVADVWVATRASLAVGFGMPTAVTELNGTNNDLPYWISADNCIAYLTKQSMAPTGAPIVRMYRAEKPL
jgi:hypothetical protein